MSVLSVNYQSLHYLARSIASVRRVLPEAEIIVVNNDPREYRGLETLGMRVQARILSTGRNIGFGAACNRGARVATRDYLLFLNPDTVILDFRVTREELAKHPLLGAQLVDGTGERERTPYGGQTPTLLRIAWDKLGRGDIGRTVLPEWVSGAAMLVSREDFLTLGGFDERYFLYFEDVDFCLRFWKARGRCALSENFSVFHERGGSQTSTGSEQKKWYDASQSLFFRTYASFPEQTILALLRFFFR